MRLSSHRFGFVARDSDKERDPLGAGTTLAASYDPESDLPATASGSAGLSRPEGGASAASVRAEGPRAEQRGERARVTDQATLSDGSLLWSPDRPFTDDADVARRGRRKRRHGRERSRSEPMAACVRYPNDGRLVIPSVQLRNAIGEWIDSSADWAWFATFTFVYDVSPEAALARYDRWLARLAEAIRQKSRCSPELQSACAIEWTHAKRVHLHSVIAGRGLSDHRRLRWQHRWEDQDRCCGMARVLPATGRASAYLAKYCGKGGIVVVRGRFAGWSASHNA
jgi:hypothetical protein